MDETGTFEKNGEIAEPPRQHLITHRPAPFSPVQRQRKFFDNETMLKRLVRGVGTSELLPVATLKTHFCSLGYDIGTQFHLHATLESPADSNVEENNGIFTHAVSFFLSWNL